MPAKCKARLRKKPSSACGLDGHSPHGARSAAGRQAGKLKPEGTRDGMASAPASAAERACRKTLNMHICHANLPRGMGPGAGRATCFLAAGAASDRAQILSSACFRDSKVYIIIIMGHFEPSKRGRVEPRNGPLSGRCAPQAQGPFFVFPRPPSLRGNAAWACRIGGLWGLAFQPQNLRLVAAGCPRGAFRHSADARADRRAKKVLRGLCSPRRGSDPSAVRPWACS